MTHFPIEKVETHLVATPLTPPIIHPFLGARTRFVSLIVLVHTKGGPTGFGYMTGESPRQMAAIGKIVEDLALRMIADGTDARHSAHFYERMWNWTVDLLHEGAATLAISALDIALWTSRARRPANRSGGCWVGRGVRFRPMPAKAYGGISALRNWRRPGPAWWRAASMR